MISRTGIFVLLGACIIAGIFIAGCTQPQATTAVQTTAPSATTAPAAEVTAGMANPASVNCGTVGGKTEIKTAADGGQYGMCMFPNGTSCEEWALFRGEGCKPYTAPTVAATTTAVTNATTEATATATATASK